MIRRIDLRGSTDDPRTALPRAALDVADAGEQIKPILADVRDHGADAVLRWSEALDGVRPPSLRVPSSVLEQAQAQLDPAVRAALLEAIARARRVHEDQRRVDVSTVVVPGAPSPSAGSRSIEWACTCPAAVLSIRAASS